MFAPWILALGLLAIGAPAADVPADNTRQVELTARAALERLPGQTAFLFTELTDQGPQPLYAIRPQDRFAVGSSFKLYILGTLADELNADRRELANGMRLRADLVGPPHSELADWPVGSPVTLHTLALKMISISDNTATDHLLYLLGRERVERQLAVMGHAQPQWNRPLLSTREMTMLRDKKTGLPGRAYQEMSEATRRTRLAALSAGVPNYDALDFDASAYHLAEWYATPFDMAQALAWLARHTRPEQSAFPLRAILAVEPKLPHDQAVWPYVGFKGGSEDQLLAGNWLLRHANGRWFTLHVYWNSPRAKVDAERMLESVGEIFAAVTAALN